MKSSRRPKKHTNVTSATQSAAISSAFLQKLSRNAVGEALVAGISGAQLTKDSTLKHLQQFHPRIKYSKHKNPTIHNPIVAKHITQSAPLSLTTSSPVTTITPLTLQQSPPSITATIPVAHSLARAIWSTDPTRTLEIHRHLNQQQSPHHQQQQPQNLHQKSSLKIIQQVETPPHQQVKAQIPESETHVLLVPTSNTSEIEESLNQKLVVQEANQSPGGTEITTTSIIMTDLEQYAEIDDIQLPDGSQIGFGDDEMSQNEDRKFSSGSVDDDYSMAHYSNNVTKFEYLSDSAISANNEEGNRQYICRHCGKRYRWKSTLRRHENVECGGKEPMHQCPHCPYKAKQRGNLGVHIRKHHGSMPPLESRRKSNKGVDLQERINITQ